MTMISTKCFSIFLSLLFFVTSLWGQAQDIRFKHLTVDDGLSQSWVNSICQDMYGFLWFATEDGLNRYDGFTFKVYKYKQRNKFSISSSNITFLFEDSKNTLWIGTNQGLNYYDRQNDRFIQNPEWPQITVKTIAEDENNNLWVGTYAGLYYLDFKKDTVKVYKPKEYIPTKAILAVLLLITYLLTVKRMYG